MGEKNLGSQSRKGLIWDMGGTLLRQLGTMGISIVLARLLEPAEFGIVGMALVFITLSQVFIDVGFTSGLIQRKEVSQETWSSVFYVNLAISLIIGVGIYFTAPLIGRFFNSVQVQDVIRYLIWVLPIAALGKVHAALLVKRMNFKALVLRDVSATIVGGIVGIIAAYSGQGVYSLVWQQITSAAVGTILLWFGTGWKPQWATFSFKEIQSLLSYSSYVFFDTLLQQLFNKIDTIFIGKFFSPVVLGFYSRAESFKSLVNNYTTKSIGKIAFPLFSAIQDDNERLNEIFARIISVLVVLTTIMVGVLFFAADWFIVFLLGEKWQPSVPIFQILIFASITLPFRTILFKAMLGLGFSRLKFSMGIFNNIVALASMPIGYFYGVEAFAWSIVGTRLFSTVVNWLIFRKRMPIVFESFNRTVLIPLLNLSFWVTLYYIGWKELVPLVWILLFLTAHLVCLTLTQNMGLKYLLVEVQRVKKLIYRKAIS